MKKILNYYPNVFRDAVKNIPKSIKNDEIVSIVDIEETFIGRGYVTLNTSEYWPLKRGFYSEADEILGLIIDYFDKYISFQIRNSIKKVYKSKGIYERSDIENRTIEVVEQKIWMLYGKIPNRIDNNVKYSIDILEGQKTIFFRSKSL